MPQRSRLSGKSPRTPWRPTEIQRDYRTLLDWAKERPQDIVDSDGDVLILQSKDRAELESEIHQQLAETARFHAVWSAHRGESPRTWAAQTAYPFVAALSVDEATAFARELLACTLDAGRRGTLEQLRGNLRAWESTAETYAQPEILASLLQRAVDDIVEVFPPSTDTGGE